MQREGDLPGNVRAASGRTFVALVAAFGAALLLALPGGTRADDASLLRALGTGGHVALLRHALAPGTGDPADFKLGDCATQRNLNAEGRRQAARIGARLRAAGIAAALVYSSQWCRCVDTARGLGLGAVRPLPALNSFFRDYERREPQTGTLKKWLAAQDLERPIVLVTHQVNITALTGVYPASGELVILRRSSSGKLSVAGTVRTD